MENKAVLLEIFESIAVITLNRPERYNAVNQDLIEGINYVFSVIKNDNNTLLDIEDTEINFVSLNQQLIIESDNLDNYGEKLINNL